MGMLNKWRDGKGGRKSESSKTWNKRRVNIKKNEKEIKSNKSIIKVPHKEGKKSKNWWNY